MIAMNETTPTRLANIKASLGETDTKKCLGWQKGFEPKWLMEMPMVVLVNQFFVEREVQTHNVECRLTAINYGGRYGGDSDDYAVHNEEDGCHKNDRPYCKMASILIVADLGTHDIHI